MDFKYAYLNPECPYMQRDDSLQNQLIIFSYIVIDIEPIHMSMVVPIISHSQTKNHKHTHTRIYINIYIYIYAIYFITVLYV